MKRELLENVKVQPYTSGDAIDREGYLSAVLGVSLGAATSTSTGITVKVTFTECDTEGGSYTPVADKLVVPGKTTDDTGAVTIEADPAGSELHNIDIDLVGCKQFIKATVAVECTGGTSPSCTATCAIALGDRGAAGVRRETAMSRVYKQPRPESNKKAAPVTETKDTGSAGKGKKNTEKVEEGGE